MEDIEIKTETQKFKYRVNGIIIKDNKVLTLRMKNNVSFCLPGGHVELGEDTRTAVIREMLEETETPVTILNELAIVESFYKDKKGLDTHEISFYYIVEPENYNKISLENYTRTENDNEEIKQHNFEWLKLSEISSVDFRPSYIKDKLANNDLSFEHLIIKE